MSSMKLCALPIIGFVWLMLLQLSHGLGLLAPSPAPLGPPSDGTVIDQGIACVLMLVALVITYLVH